MSGLPWQSEAFTESPVVSVILFCRNGAKTLRRSLESVASQTYRDFEYVVQDAASTDGTLDLLREYRDKLNIQLVSEPDQGPADGFWRALRRCRGHIIATCLADEELMHDALERAVRLFGERPYLGAITGDAYVTDAAGDIQSIHKSAPFSFARYLAAEYCPYWSSSFFSMRALKSVGILDSRWSADSLEFEIWCRLAENYEIAYVPSILSKYGIHAGQLSNQGARALTELKSRLKIIREHVFRPQGVFGNDATWQDRCVLLQQVNLLNHLLAYRVPDASTLQREIMKNDNFEEILTASIRTVRRRSKKRPGLEAVMSQLYSSRVLRRVGNRIVLRLWTMLPRTIRARVPPGPRARVKWLLGVPDSSSGPRLQLPRIPWMRKVLLDMQACHDLRMAHEAVTAYYANRAASFFEDRGQIEQAINEWEVAGRLEDEGIDSRKCQALLKSTNATDADRLQAQSEWAGRHALKPDALTAAKFADYDGHRRLVVGYICAWWDSDTVRGQALPFISRHDRAKFRIIGYSLDHCGSEITRHFDEFKTIRKLTHREFAELVRRDKVDVLVEFTGFSPHHRFAAMGARCAPVQVSYLNHAGTSGVQNVDYVIADAIAAPNGLEANYSERILRLPGTFFNFNYDGYEFPESGPPPCLDNRLITFGCFGSQSKINDAQIYMWARLLLALPDARLFLRNRGLDSANNRAFMARRFAQWGVEPSRLRIEPGGDRYSILDSYAEVDISLDTWPYNGGNTIAESLWQGVPVITLLGDSFNSRYGASLLRASGCWDLVADNLNGMIEIARNLSRDTARLVDLRRNLRQMMRQYGFSDSERFCRTWEAGIRAALKRAAAHGRPPRPD